MQFRNLAISMLSIASAFIPIKQLSTLSYSRSAIKARNNIKMNSNKLITISPGGLLGFYMFGVSKYIKDNYKLDKSYIYSGASAGSWNSLFMVFNGNNNEFIDIILKNTPKNNIERLEHNLKKDIMTNYDTRDFNLQNLYIGVSTLENYKFRLDIYNNFNTLEDALDCCIISSHIPFITGKPCKKYKGKYSFDGGLYGYPYTNISNPILKITPDIWGRNYPNINLYSTYNIDYNKLFNEGYEDSFKNRAFLDNIFKK